MGRTERLSISGWFHAAQEGEKGYIPEVSDPEMKSNWWVVVISFSYNRLTSVLLLLLILNIDVNTNCIQVLSSTFSKSWPRNPEPSQRTYPFSCRIYQSCIPSTQTIQTLASRFVQESSLELHSFLNNQLGAALEYRLRDLDTRDGLGQSFHHTQPVSPAVGPSKVLPTDGVTARLNPQKAVSGLSHIRIHIIHL